MFVEVQRDLTEQIVRYGLILGPIADDLASVLLYGRNSKRRLYNTQWDYHISL